MDIHPFEMFMHAGDNMKKREVDIYSFDRNRNIPAGRTQGRRVETGASAERIGQAALIPEENKHPGESSPRERDHTFMLCRKA